MALAAVLIGDNNLIANRSHLATVLKRLPPGHQTDLNIQHTPYIDCFLLCGPTVPADSTVSFPVTHTVIITASHAHMRSYKWMEF